MILVIDNYDSFTYNLVHFLGELGAELDRPPQRQDHASTRSWRWRPEAIVLSPGPCTPNEAGICLDLIETARPDNPDPRRLPRPPGHRPGLWRRRRPRADADARQDQHDPPHRPRRVPRPQRRLRGDALPLADRRARQPAGRRSRSTASDRRRRDHGRAAQDASRSTASSSIPSASPPRTATRSSRISSTSPPTATSQPRGANGAWR